MDKPALNRKLFYRLLLFLPLLFSSFSLHAQYEVDENEVKHYPRTEFCRMLDRVMAQADTQFVTAKDSLKSSLAGTSVWYANQGFSFGEARSCVVEESIKGTTYKAVFLARDTKEGLAASYRNILFQLKECLGEAYEYDEKKSRAYNTVYECEIKPIIGEAQYESRLRLSVERNWRTLLYELVMEVYK